MKSLVKMLKGVEAAFGTDLQPNLSYQEKREQYVMALISIATFFKEIDCPLHNSLFWELASAIGDRNTGVQYHPLLDADIPAVTRSDSSPTWRARAQAALALEALIAAGDSPAEAAAKIVSKNSGLKALAGAKSESLTNTLLNWRKEFRQNRVKNFEAAELFQAGQELIKAHTEDATELRDLSREWLLAAKRVFSPGA
jgi:hypothetical protein